MNSSSIHPTAVVDPSAKLGKDVMVAPFAIIGADVTLGDGCKVDGHVVIKGPSKFGANNYFAPFSCVGEAPQDKKFAGEQTWLEVGDDNVFREFCTVHRGTTQDQGKTIIGNNNLFMAYTHVAHDCIVGDHNILSNNASLAGHVTVGNHAILGGFTGVHQFCKVGDYAFLGRGPIITMDVLPFAMVAGNTPSLHGVNVEGLKRAEYSRERITAIRNAYKLIFRSNLPLAEATRQLESTGTDSEDVRLILDFISNSERGLQR